jgi:hypothetical protein
MIRKILAVIAGYAVFAVSSVLLFRLTGQAPHAEAPLTFKLLTLVYGICFAVAAGYVLRLIAKTQTLNLNFILAFMIFLLAALSLFLSRGNHWTQLFAMLIFAPMSVLGGYLYNNLKK